MKSPVPNATALTDWMKLTEAFHASPDDASRYNWQFPMGVFGTLRERCSNNRLMHRNGEPYKIIRAFLPHFHARGLGIRFEQGASAPFEVFFYEPDTWDSMIPSVDRLESFSPEIYTEVKAKKASYGYYFRTLVTLRLLPDDFNHKLFPKKEHVDLGEYRNLEIPPADFNKFQPVPAWVYSGLDSNRKLVAAPQLEGNNPVPVIQWPTTV